MLEQMFLKRIAGRLVEDGSCPGDPHCPYAGGTECRADQGALLEKEKAMKRALSKEVEEEHAGEDIAVTVMLSLNPKDPWPCVDPKALYILILPPELKGDDPDD